MALHFLVLYQLWMMQPRYQDIPSDDIPTVESNDGKIWAKVVAGEALGAKAVIDTVIPIQFIHYRMRTI